MADPKLNARLGLDKKEFDKGLKDAEKSVAGFGNSLKGLATAAGLAFGIKEVVRFGAEAFKLAATAEGIRAAFKKLNDPMLLINLRKATKNTVTDVELMSAAVRSSHFNIALSQLPKYFEFAARRARETGESVDYLVNSIVQGIGQRSSRVLDNLGISATELNEELKVTPDYATAVGNIIDRSMKSAGESIDTTADSIAEMNAQWINIKTTLGGLIAEGGVGGTVGMLAAQLNFLNVVLEGNSKNAEEADKKLGYYLIHWKEATKIIFGGLAGGIANKRAQKGTLPILAGKPIIRAGGTSGGSAAMGGGAMSSLWHGRIGESGINTSAGAASLPTLSQIQTTQLAIMDGAKGVSQVMIDQIALGTTMTNVFSNMFSVMGEGWGAMADALIASIKQIAQEIIARAAAWALLTLITGGTFSLASLGGFLGLTNIGGGATRVNNSLPGAVGSTQFGSQLQVVGVIKGTDIALSGSRGGNSLYNGT